MQNMREAIVAGLKKVEDREDLAMLAEQVFNGFSEIDKKALFSLDFPFEADWKTHRRQVFFHAVVTGGRVLPATFAQALAAKRVVLVGDVESLHHGFPEFLKEDGVLVNFDDVKNPEAEDLLFIEAGKKIEGKLREKVALRIVTADSLMRKLVNEHGTFDRETLVAMLLAFGAKQAVLAPKPNVFVIDGRHKVWQVEITDNTVIVGDKAFVENTFIGGAIDGNAAAGVLSWKTAILTLAYAFQGGEDSSIDGRFAYTTEAFLEGPGGSEGSSRSDMVKRHKVGILQLGCISGFGLSVRNGSLKDVNDALFGFLTAGVPAAIQHQGQWISVHDGARAMGVDFCSPGVLSAFYVADKVTKFANRAALGIAPTAWSENLEESQYQIKMADGSAVAIKGIRVALRVANTSNVNLGSGGAAVPVNGYELSVGSSRVVRTATLQSRTKNNPAAQEAEVLAELVVYSQVQEGASIAGQRVIVDGKEVVRPIEGLRWDVQNTVLHVKEFEVKAVPGSLNDVKVTIVGSWRAKSVGEKLKFDGGKLRTVMAEIITRDENGNDLPEYTGITVSDEAAKGLQIFIVIWAHSDKEYFQGKPLILTPSGGLGEADRKRFTEWLKLNTRREWIGMRKNRKHYVHFKAMFGTSADWKFNDETQEVMHLCDVVYGEVVTPIEYTTTYENAGTSQAYPELALAMERVSPKLAMYYWSQGNDLRKAYRDLFKCYNGTAQVNEVVMLDNEATLFDLSKFDGDKLVWEFKSEMLSGKSTKAIMKTLAKRFPTGCSFVMGNRVVQVDFKALSRVDNYVTGGKSVGPANEMAMLISGLATPVEDRNQGFESFLLSRINKYTTELRTLFENPGACRRPMRVGLLHTRKVATNDAYWVDPWVVYFNPNDPLITSGKVKVGEYYGVGRMPMISFGMFRVETHEHVAIGTFLVDPFSWAACNEGDADGDGGFLFHIPDELVKEVLAALKTGIFGPKGYSATYTKLPYEDFMKLSPTKAPRPVPGNEAFWDAEGNLKWNGSEISVEALVDLHKNLSHHYTTNVGTGYQVAAYLLYWVSRNSTQKALSKDKFAAQELACVWAWRVLYEKFGLGGYDPKTIRVSDLETVPVYERMWDMLNKLASKYVKATVFSEETGRFVANVALRETLIDQFVEIVDLVSSVSDLKPLNRESAAYILRARALGIMGSDMERNVDLRTAVKGETKLAAEFLLLRRASKGLLASEKNFNKDNLDNAVNNGTTAVEVLDREYRAKDEEGRFPQGLLDLNQGLYSSMLVSMFDLHTDAVAAVRTKRIAEATKAI